MMHTIVILFSIFLLQHSQISQYQETFFLTGDAVAHSISIAVKRRSLPLAVLCNKNMTVLSS